VLVVNCGVLELFAFGISSAHADSAAFASGKMTTRPLAVVFPAFFTTKSSVRSSKLDVGVPKPLSRPNRLLHLKNHLSWLDL
jgi:hypothetical protein